MTSSHLTKGGRNHHVMSFQTPTAGTDIYIGTCRFSPQTINACNALPESVIPHAEIADDCVVKFISLVRARG